MKFEGKYLFITFFIFVFIILFSSIAHPRILHQTDYSKNKKYGFSENLKITANSGRITIVNNWSEGIDAGIFTGTGTFSDPYVIQDLIIYGNGTGTGISIANSKNVYLRIENCSIFNFTYGIRLTWSCNVTLLNNNCSNNEIGIYLDGWTDILNPTQEIIAQCYCMNNSILNNSINYNQQYGLHMRHSEENKMNGNEINHNFDGIYLVMQSDNNTIQYNFLKKNERHGIYLRDSSNNTIKRNKMESCGFYSDIDVLIYNYIDTTNLVNDGHLYFYVNMTNLNENDFSNAGQVYLINCNHSIIANADLSDGSLSISLLDCNNIKILHNNLSSNYLNGIYAINCNNMIIESNIIDSNLDEGIYISSGENNSFVNNIIKNNGYRAGIRAFGFCNNNTFLNNNFENNLEGLSFGYSCTNNIISDNLFINNQLTGITFEGGCELNLIYFNSFRKNALHVITVLNNHWNNSDIGNYWDNYTGIDINGDGIGDVPHNISLDPLIQDFLPIVDNQAPEITIILPSNNFVFGNIAPNFIITVKGKYLDELWYTLDDGLHNYHFISNGTINQDAWNNAPKGEIIITFYALDRAGNIGNESVIVIKRISSEKTLIPGYNLWIMLFLTFLILIFFTYKRKRMF